MSAVGTGDVLRELAHRTYGHCVVSVFLDLDPTVFGTAPARATEIRSLIDSARRQLRCADHADDRVALEQDIGAIEQYLTQELDAAGSRGVAVYASGRAGLFEVVPVTEPGASCAAIEPIPRLEPLLPAQEPACVGIALVSRRAAVLLTRTRAGELERVEFEDEVHGQHRQGGRSESQYERSVEDEVDTHLRRVAEETYRLWQRDGFKRLVLGGPHEVIARLVPKLHADLRPLVDPTELHVDVASTTAQIEQALRPLRERWRAEAQDEAVSELLSRLGSRPRAAAGLADTLAAVNERRVQTLLLAPDIDLAGACCPECQMLHGAELSTCPADGTTLRQLPSLRSAIIRQALLQDAEVIVLAEHATAADHDAPPLSQRPEVAAFEGIGALLRF